MEKKSFIEKRHIFEITNTPKIKILDHNEQQIWKQNRFISVMNLFLVCCDLYLPRYTINNKKMANPGPTP
jgi:hypothetical protein